jgi:hypothetical protein
MMINGLESTKFTLTPSDLDDINVIAQSYDIYDRRVRERGHGTISEFGIRTEGYAVIHARDLGGLGFMVATLEGIILEYGFDLQLRMNAI